MSQIRFQGVTVITFPFSLTTNEMEKIATKEWLFPQQAEAEDGTMYTAIFPTVLDFLLSREDSERTILVLAPWGTLPEEIQEMRRKTPFTFYALPSSHINSRVDVNFITEKVMVSEFQREMILAAAEKDSDVPFSESRKASLYNPPPYTSVRSSDLEFLLERGRKIKGLIEYISSSVSVPGKHLILTENYPNEIALFLEFSGITIDKAVVATAPPKDDLNGFTHLHLIDGYDFLKFRSFFNLMKKEHHFTVVVWVAITFDRLFPDEFLTIPFFDALHGSSALFYVGENSRGIK